MGNRYSKWLDPLSLALSLIPIPDSPLSKRPPNSIASPQRCMRRVVMFAIRTREADRHGEVIAFARRPHALAARQHADTYALDDLGHAALEIRVGAAHRGD